MLVYLRDPHLKHAHSQHDSICYTIKMKNTKYLFPSSGMLYISGFQKIVIWFKIARYGGGGSCDVGGRSETDGHTEMMIP